MKIKDQTPMCDDHVRRVTIEVCDHCGREQRADDMIKDGDAFICRRIYCLNRMVECSECHENLDPDTCHRGNEDDYGVQLPFCSPECEGSYLSGSAESACEGDR